MSLADFYSPKDAGRADNILLKIVNTVIGVLSDPSWKMLELQTLREEYFDEVGAHRDEQCDLL